MGVKIGLISVILAFTNLFLRKWLVGTGKQQLSEQGKRVSIWGTIIIALFAIIMIILLDDTEINIMKWLMMLLIIIAVGFQCFIDWKYLKGTKVWIVSLSLLIMGVTLVYFLI